MEPVALVDNNSTEWLMAKDAVLSVEVVRLAAGSRVLEVGVWKGGWTLTILSNVPASEVVGIDPYPWSNGPTARSRMEINLADAGVAERFTLFPSWGALHDAGAGTPPFDVCHIDGSHLEADAAADLEQAAGVLAEGGAIIVDDIHHLAYPGVAASMFRFLEPHDFRVFLMTEKKAYLCRAADVARWRSALERALASQDAIAWSYVGPTYASTVSSDDMIATVLGEPVILAVGAGPTPRPATATRSGWARSLRRLAHDLTPPIIARRVRAARRSR